MTEITYTCIHENKHHSYSDVFGSREIAKYRIGRPDGSPMKLFNVSEAEAISIVTNLPEELLEVVKEHYGLVDAATLGEVPPILPDESDDTQDIDVDRLEVTVDSIFLTEDGDLDMKIDDMNVKELKALCKQLGITGYSDLNKEELIAAINKEVDENAEV